MMRMLKNQNITKPRTYIYLLCNTSLKIPNFEFQIPIKTQHMFVFELKCGISHLVFIHIDQFYAKLDAIWTHLSEFCNPQSNNIFIFSLC